MSKSAAGTLVRRPKFAARVVFIERSAEIERELQQGRGLVEIHTRLGLHDAISYSQFTKLVRRFFPNAMQLSVAKPRLSSPPAPRPISIEPEPAAQPVMDLPVPPPPPPDPAVRKGFIFSPRSNLKII